MPRNSSPTSKRTSTRAPKESTRRPGKKKVCIFCTDKTEWIDYKDVNVLRRFLSDRGKIKARRTTGTCVQHQRDVATAIKTSRELALLPYTQRTVSERIGGRGGRGGGGGGGGGGGSGGRPPRGEAVEDRVVESAGAGDLVGVEAGAGASAEVDE
jgi:small subunit ribosomal protein S18